MHPSKHAGSDSEAFWLRPVMAITASVLPESGRIVNMPDPTPRIRFSSVFPKKTWIILCKTDPDPMWMALPGLGRMHPVRKQCGVPESSGPVSGRTQPARYQFPHFLTRFRSSTDGPDNIVQSQPGSDWALADCVLFLAKRIQSESKPVCKDHRTCFSPFSSKDVDTVL